MGDRTKTWEPSEINTNLKSAPEVKEIRRWATLWQELTDVSDNE